MNNRINLVIGDRSGDGHDKRETISISCNLSVELLHKAYDKGTKKLGFDLIKSVCEEYEDNHLRYNEAKILSDNGFDVVNNLYDGENFLTTRAIPLMPEEWVTIFMFICKLGNKTVEYEVVENDSLYIGGYGLFP